jgi:hypothetical protein
MIHKIQNILIYKSDYFTHFFALNFRPKLIPEIDYSWKLDKKLGVILLVWYFIFMLFASLYELNVFGEFNPPECTSSY